MTPRRPFLLVAIAALLAAGLSGCGRRGPLELPPEVQERGKALAAQEAAKPRPKARAGEEPAPDKIRIPGTPGNRPPEQYPFPLDPLL